MPTIARASLCELPQPMHLFAALFRGCHYHFGCFESPGATLEEAQQSLTGKVAARVPRGARVLDVGCGLGGTVHELARRGHPAVGIDRCEPAVEFARGGAGSGVLPRFVVASFEEHGEEPGAPAFDALVLVEVLQHLPPLERMLRRALDFLRPAGTLVIADVVNRTELPFERVPFHPAGSLAARAPESGFECLEAVDLTEQVAATPARLVDHVGRSRASLHRRFPGRAALEHEIDELIRQCELLDRAFRHGDLGYELVTLRHAPRAGSTGSR